jgi:hypothetical protein
MTFLIHDKTGTQTNSVAPLSRKKLKALMPQNPHLGSKKLLEEWGRKIGRKRRERGRLREQFRKVTLADGTTAQLVPTAAEVEKMKPTIFERLGGFFGNLRRKAERESARGK